MLQQSPEPTDKLDGHAYEAPSLVVIGSIDQFTFGSNQGNVADGAGTFRLVA